MKNKNTKVVAILLIILLIVISLATATTAMMFTGKIALTDKQKLVKGFNDIKAKFNNKSTQENTLMKDFERMYTTPFESQTIITGKVNALEIEGVENNQEISEILNEIKTLVNNIKITNTVQADLKDEKMVENLKLEMGNVVEEISLDLEYNKDTIALRSKELNEKFLTITKDNAELDSQYEDLLEVFESFETLCEKPNFSQLEFTEEEIIHFQEYYKGVVSKYLTEDMITSTKSTVTVEGKETSCSAVSITLEKQHMQEIVGEYLQLFESDTIGKTIVLDKLKNTEIDITEEYIEDFIDDIRSELEYLDEDVKITFTIYCNNFKTFGFDIIFADSTSKSIIKTVFETNKTIIKLVLSEIEDGKSTATETELGTIIISDNELNVVLTAEDTYMNLNLKEEENKLTMMVSMKREDVSLNLTLKNEHIENTETEILEKNSINFAVKSEEVAIDITLNADSKLTYLSSIPITTLTSENSLNVLTGSQTDLQQYIMDATPKAQALLQTAQQNSEIINGLLSTYTEIQEDVNEVTENVNETVSNQAVQSFNMLFEKFKGVQKGSSIKGLLDTITFNNQQGHRIVNVIIVDKNNTIKVNTNNSAEIVIAMNDIVNSGEYLVAIAEYDTEGYIKTIAIKQNF